MYDYISGKLTVKNLEYACIDINGLAYLCYIPFKTYENLVAINEKEKLYTYMYVKEDLIKLYGFKTIEERKIFKLVISVSGIGPKIALAILSVYSPNEIINIVKINDAKMLSKVNGLGLKKAQKLIIELSDKVEDIEISETQDFNILLIKNELKLALESLGYNKIKLEDYLSDEEIMNYKDSAILMKLVLKKLAKK